MAARFTTCLRQSSGDSWMLASRPLPSARFKQPFPYLILDARYEKVREAGRWPAVERIDTRCKPE